MPPKTVTILFSMIVRLALHLIILFVRSQSEFVYYIIPLHYLLKKLTLDVHAPDMSVVWCILRMEWHHWKAFWSCVLL